MKHIVPLVLGSALLVLPLAAQAQESTVDRQACEPDVNRICSEFIPDRDRIIVCLDKKIRQLSPACQSVMRFYAVQQVCAREAASVCADAAPNDHTALIACLRFKARALGAACRRAVVAGS